jgi:hypothetical protein
MRGCSVPSFACDRTRGDVTVKVWYICDKEHEEPHPEHPRCTWAARLAMPRSIVCALSVPHDCDLGLWESVVMGLRSEDKQALFVIEARPQARMH